MRLRFPCGRLKTFLHFLFPRGTIAKARIFPDAQATLFLGSTCPVFAFQGKTFFPFFLGKMHFSNTTERPANVVIKVTFACLYDPLAWGQTLGSWRNFGFFW